MQLPEKEIELEMSNFDHTIDPGFAEALQKEKCFGHHAAYNFNGLVWWDNCYHEEVWIFHQPIKVISANTLEELMKEVNDEFGWE